MIIEQMLKNAPKPLLHTADVSGNALFQGDCLDIMPLMPDKSVQLIFADLPYGTTQCKWDSVLPFDKLWKEYERIITDNGVILLTASQPFTSAVVMSNPKLFKYEWIWHKDKGGNPLNAKIQPMKQHESILVFCKGKATYNPILEERSESGRKRVLRRVKGGSIKDDAVYGQTNIIFANYNEKRLPQTVQYFNVERGLHPTQKPLQMAKYFIETHSNENDMVLDNTMGSGTFCLAAKELNRKFIGIEKEANYYEIACRRCGF
jgi:site-specific DNA-methyltransferase (adenine-specific)